jgi:hypothetical protein
VPTPSSRAVTGARMTRRAALAAAAGLSVGAVVGCTSQRQGRRGEEPPEPVEPEVDPDVAVAAEALANQEQILELLGATGERHPGLGRALAAVVAAHEAHAALLADAVPPEVTAEPTTSPTASPAPGGADTQATPESPEGSPSPDGRRTQVPRNPARALDRVVAAERELATATKQHAFRARSGGFARLLASMAAAAAQHEVVLASSAPAGGRG